jgi:uncharacterized protein YciI
MAVGSRAYRRTLGGQDMASDSVAAAYAPFVASLLAGGFGEPADGGWTAELVAAHVIKNNDLIAATAELVADGAEVSYDNASTIDEVELAAYAVSVGGLAGLAGEVERSASRLEAAGEALGDKAGTPVHVIIRDGGDIVQDGPIPIGAFVEGNATFHLNLHHDQLKALELPRAPEAPPTEFDIYQLILLVRAPDGPQLDDAASTALGLQHLGHFGKMHAAGFLRVAGPIEGDDDIAGICIYQAGSVERARKLAEDDPAVRAGRFVVRAMTWYTQKGALPWDADL